MTRFAPLLALAALVAGPAAAQSVADFAQPCLAHDQDAAVVAAAFEAEGWRPLAPGPERDAAASAIAGAVIAFRFAPRGEIDAERLTRFARYAPEEARGRYPERDGVLLFEREGQFAAWQVYEFGSLYQVLCEFAAEVLPLDEAALRSPSGDRPYWFAAFSENTDSDGVETVVSAIRYTIDLSSAAPLVRDGYTISRQFDEAPQ